MAEGWAAHLNSDTLEPFSAGIETHGLNRYAVSVMNEVGIDISNHRSKYMDELKEIDFDYVITVCDNAHESCPIFPGETKVVHVGFDDPPKLAETAGSEEEKLNCYRLVRDQIRDYIEQMPDNLDNT